MLVTVIAAWLVASQKEVEKELAIHTCSDFSILLGFLNIRGAVKNRPMA